MAPIQGPWGAFLPESLHPYEGGGSRVGSGKHDLPMRLHTEGLAAAGTRCSYLGADI